MDVLAIQREFGSRQLLVMCFIRHTVAAAPRRAHHPRADPAHTHTHALQQLHAQHLAPQQHGHAFTAKPTPVSVYRVTVFSTTSPLAPSHAPKSR